jgi:hypothetical protein
LQQDNPPLPAATGTGSPERLLCGPNRWATDSVTDRKENEFSISGSAAAVVIVSISLFAQISPVSCVDDHGVSAYRLQPVRICVIDKRGAARRPQLMD